MPGGLVDVDRRQVARVLNEPVGLQGAEHSAQELARRIFEAQREDGLSTLAVGVAHDLNNLLLGILCHADLGLVDPELPESVVACLHGVRQAARRAGGLTQQMLAYFGHADFKVENADPGQLVAELTDLLRASVSPQVSLTIHCPDDLPALFCDVIQIRQVLMNLLLNAVEALGDEAGAIRLEVRCVDEDAPELEVVRQDATVQGQFVLFEVSDDGPGIAPENLDRVFAPYFTTKPGGHGLGLATVRCILRGHGGGIEVLSTPGHGAMFRAILPVSARQPLGTALQ